MAETLYGDRQDAGARVDPPAPRPLLPMQAGRAKPRPAGLLASVRAALDDRRGFVLLPFGMIGGLMVAASLPNEPQVSLLAAGAVLLCVGLAVSARSLALTRIMVALVAVWLGFCLLPIHGALFGTQMLVRPAYGT